MNRLIYQSLNDIILCRGGGGGGGGMERGTQQENSYTKHTITNRIPVTAALGRVNEASHWNLLTH